MDNPYSAPEARLETTTTLSREDARKLEQVRTGQRLVIWAILLYFGIAALSAVSSQKPDPLVMIVIGGMMVLAMLTMLVLSVMGMFRIWAGLNTHIVIRILLFVLMFVPLAGLLILVRTSSNATKRLRENGYRVGLLGAAPLPRTVSGR